MVKLDELSDEEKISGEEVVAVHLGQDSLNPDLAGVVPHLGKVKDTLNSNLTGVALELGHNSPKSNGVGLHHLRKGSNLHLGQSSPNSKGVALDLCHDSSKSNGVGGLHHLRKGSNLHLGQSLPNTKGVALDLGHDPPKPNGVAQASSTQDVEPSTCNLGQNSTQQQQQQQQPVDFNWSSVFDLDPSNSNLRHLFSTSTHEQRVELDWASAPEDGAWAAGAWGPGKWKAILPELPPSLWHWCLRNRYIEITEGKVDTWYRRKMMRAEKHRALINGLPEEELMAIDTFYLPYFFLLEDSKKDFKDPENVLLCELYDEFRDLVLPELYYDIYCPDVDNRDPKLLHELTVILEKAMDVTLSIESRGNLAMPIPFKWWLDWNARRRNMFAIAEKGRKIAMGKND